MEHRTQKLWTTKMYIKYIKNQTRTREATRLEGIKNDWCLCQASKSTFDLVYDLDLWPPDPKVDCFMLFSRVPPVPICIKVISLICLPNIVFPSLVTDEQTNGLTDNLRTMSLPCSQTGLAVALFTYYFFYYTVIS